MEMRAAGAARRIDDLLAAKAEDPTQALAEAGRLLEEAMPPGAAAAPAPAAPGPQSRPGAGPSEPAEGPAVDMDLLPDFIAESREYIEGAEAALLALESASGDVEAINTVFRAFHTIKGTSAFLGLGPVSELAHHAESLFDRFRNGELRCSGPLADVSLRAVDLLKALLAACERVLGGEPFETPGGYAELMAILSDPETVGRLNAPETRLGDILVAQGKVSRETVEAVASLQGNDPIGVAIVRSEAATLTDVAQALRKQNVSQSAEGIAETFVRVRTDQLDQLVDMIGELVIAQSMITQDAAVSRADDAFGRKVSHADKIVRELQDLSVSLRMVPLRATFQKLARLVRDVARKSGKQVDFEVQGEDTEIDRNMAGVIGDPLVHMIRNAVDHGIEPPEVREAVGKPRTGRVRLSAYHAGGNVVVALQDDGKGLDRARIVQKALAKGLIEADRVLTDSEVFGLIFAPGFSTAEQVTDLSGRGVRMDVVKRNVEAMRGRIDIASEATRGSTFTLRLPLTLAVTDGMLVRVADERYILPTVNIQMSLRPEDLIPFGDVSAEGVLQEF